MGISESKTEYLQLLNNACHYLEPFIAGSGPFVQNIKGFAEFVSGFVPLRGLAVIRLSVDNHVQESALWRDGRVLNDKEIASYEPLDVPAWCAALLRGEDGVPFLRTIAEFSGRGAKEVDCFMALPIRDAGEMPGMMIAEKAEAWADEERQIMEGFAQMAKGAFVNRNRGESQVEQTWVFNQLMDNLRANVYVTDMETDEILFMNKIMRETYKVKRPVGKICWKVLQKGLKERCAVCPVDELKHSKEEHPACVWEEHSTLTDRYYENYDSRMPWLDGRMVHFQQSVDITDSKKVMSAAAYDELTGMFNRRVGKERLEKVLRRAEFEQIPVTVCLYDVNLLKLVNDTYGHIEGDLMLSIISKAVMETLEEDQFSFRLSGDEFMIVFYDCKEADANDAIKKIQDRIACERERMKKQYEIGFCYGLIEAPRKFVGLTKLIAEADERMYIQKRTYHNSRLNRERAERQDVTHFTCDKEHLYEALLASTDNYIYLCNMKTNIYQFPPKMVEEFGLPGEIIFDAGNLWAQLIEDSKRQEFQKQLEDLVSGASDTHDLTYRVCNKDGEWVKMRCRGTVSRDENGVAELFAGIMTKL